MMIMEDGKMSKIEYYLKAIMYLFMTYPIDCAGVGVGVGVGGGGGGGGGGWGSVRGA